MTSKIKLFNFAAMVLLILTIDVMPALAANSGIPSESEIAGTYDRDRPDASEIDENYDAFQKQMEQIYYNALEEISEEDGPMNVPFGKWVYIQFYRFYFRLKAAAPYICVISFFVGILTMAVSQQNKRIQKLALVYLVLLIPVATLLIVFAVGISPLFKTY